MLFEFLPNAPGNRVSSKFIKSHFQNLKNQKLNFSCLKLNHLKSHNVQNSFTQKTEEVTISSIQDFADMLEILDPNWRSKMTIDK